jgi:DNA-binding transcriptional MerR regulator
MLKIGDFSKLARISVRMLRHYDDLGLLKPLRVESDTGYRYYGVTQLTRLNRLLALKDLGFPLDQIGPLLDGSVSLEQLRGMLELRRAEIQSRLTEDRERLDRVEARLRHIEQENRMPDFDVIVKDVPPQLAASMRRIVPAYNQVGPLFKDLLSYALPLGAYDGTCVAMWHDAEFKDKDVDAEAIILLKRPIPASEQVRVCELPAIHAATYVFKGSYARLAEAYAIVAKWMEESGYKHAGPIREVYLKSSMPVRQDDESYVTELQFPVTR